MNWYGNQYMSQEYHPDLVNDIAKAINGEYTAIHCYGELAEAAPTKEEKNRIQEIRKDEMRHFQTFSHIYLSLTGTEPSPQLGEECAEDYLSGLEASIKDEQITVDFYHDIAAKTQNYYIKEQFTRAAADEQNHAVWFLYFYTKWCCDK